MNTAPSYHIPVMLHQCMEGLNIQPTGVYADVTFGGGGHSKEILRLLGSGGTLVGFDQDADAQRNIVKDDRFIFVHGNFRYFKNFIKYHSPGHVNGVLADLGVSSHQFDKQERGFSFRSETALDMRMNQLNPLTAADVVNTYTEEDLANVFYFYGEIRSSRRLASLICKARAEKKIKTTAELLNIAAPTIPKQMEKKEWAKLFQALRIEVNGELNALKEMLAQALELLTPGGRMVVMTYHSLEDRLVKNFLKTGNFEGKEDKDLFGKVSTPFRLINNKVIIPTEEELNTNPRSRSAKLRIAEKK